MVHFALIHLAVVHFALVHWVLIHPLMIHGFRAALGISLARIHGVPGMVHTRVHRPCGRRGHPPEIRCLAGFRINQELRRDHHPVAGNDAFENLGILIPYTSGGHVNRFEGTFFQRQNNAVSLPGADNGFPGHQGASFTGIALYVDAGEHARLQHAIGIVKAHPDLCGPGLEIDFRVHVVHAPHPAAPGHVVQGHLYRIAGTDGPELALEHLPDHPDLVKRTDGHNLISGLDECTLTDIQDINNPGSRGIESYGPLHIPGLPECPDQTVRDIQRRQTLLGRPDQARVFPVQCQEQFLLRIHQRG